MRKNLLLTITTILIAVFGPCFGQENPRPNIIVILVDDMGFSDIGCYGSEIPTPNIDKLAQNGLRLNNFYNNARCCPTRASLLTGLYPHQAGVGFMTGGNVGKGNPAYQGFLNNSSVTFAEVMKQAGYFTIMTGKWHVGQENGVTPTSRGFEKALNAPAGGFYFDEPTKKNKLYLNGNLITNNDELPKDWYATDLWTTYGLKFIDDAKAAKKPFIWYLAHNAPHFPLQAAEDEIAKFRGKYRKGWEVVRKERYERQLKMGLINKSYALPPTNPLIPKWDSLSDQEKKKQDDIMAIYAATVSRIDKSIGDLVEGLKQRGEFENTIIMFMSDNGGNAEGGTFGRYSGEKSGNVGSSVFLSQGWAELNNTPFWLYKHHTSEGGIASPFIFSWPNQLSPKLKGKIIDTPAHITDIMPTLLAISGANYPKTYNNNSILPMEGLSLLPLINSSPVERKNPIFWEHEGNRAMRSGKWKIVSNVNEAWQLYDLEKDRTELKDLSKVNSKKMKELVEVYETWYKKVGAKPYFDEPKPWQYSITDALKNSK